MWLGAPPLAMGLVATPLMHHTIEDRAKNMLVGNLFGRNVHRKVFLISANLEVGITTLVSFNFLPGNFLVGIPFTDRHAFAFANAYRAKAELLTILEFLHRLLQQRFQCKFRDFPRQVVPAPNALPE